jgi:hypothetical protein
MEKFGVVLLPIPFRRPVPINTDPETYWINLLTQKIYLLLTTGLRG